jgi:hypothetical protein
VKYITILFHDKALRKYNVHLNVIPYLACWTA